ncbi:7785_t:CDS:1 [Funneliformis geosporum]|uniref:14618_t:CDS:1 n=1 Tax=Funneliformis geosporum TaxID=1117311 RepID=A0A9W4WQY4_9GLOM|nr:7785_t:CDS:1 [Funneliformis geosporum]CAI2179720.1 14618_t:CDS:1 [Funneliformis geosporum]
MTSNIPQTQVTEQPASYLLLSTPTQTLTSKPKPKPTFATLPPELYDFIFIHCKLQDLHFNLRCANKLFYNLVSPYIIYQLRSALITEPLLQKYDQEVSIQGDVLNIKLKLKIPPFEIFPWNIKMKLCTSTKKVVTKIVKVVKQHEKKHEIGVEIMDEENNLSKKKWTWIDC